MFSIWTRERECIHQRVSKEEIYRLRGLTEDGHALRRDERDRPILGRQLIYPHPRRDAIWIIATGVSVDEVKQELRRSISLQCPSAEANATVTEVFFSNDKGAGRYFQHNDSVCSTWRDKTDYTPPPPKQNVIRMVSRSVPRTVAIGVPLPIAA